MAIYIKKEVNGVEQEPKRVGVIPNGYPARKIAHSSGGNLEEMLNYSTNEHIVGKWIDGSILYEKTVDFGALPNATNKSVAHNISNLNRIISINGYAYKSGSGSTQPLPYPDSTYGDVQLYCNTTNIYINTTANKSDFTECYITLRYTKTA